VPILLDLYKIPFVGSDGLTLGLTLDKAMTKKIFISEGLPTPKYFVATHETNLANLDSMKFPFIVKPRHEGTSKGISDDSVVFERGTLAARARYIFDSYKQPALVEEFIAGREFTVLVIGNNPPVALAPVQVKICGKEDLGNLVYTSRRVSSTDIEYVCPPDISERLAEQMKAYAVRAYQAVECRDFGRVDFRVDASDNLYMLEVNPLPSLSTEDVFPLVAKASHMTYEQLVLKIIDFALERYGLLGAA
jgi:D-alanine-D-alanine ligase